MTSRLLNRRQARWSEFLSRFNYRIQYRPGKTNGKADALSRLDRQSKDDEEAQRRHQTQVVVKSHNLGLLADIPLQDGASPLDALWDEAYQADTIPNQILKLLDEGARWSRLISLSECTRDGTRLRYQGRLYVPASDALKLYLIREHHDTPSSGHPGRSKTHELITRRFFWPGMRKDIARYVANCHICQRSRTTRHAPFGTLRPLPVPYKPWQDISMDFVTGLPWSNGNDAIWVVVDRMTKMRHLVPCRTTIDAPSLAELFLEHIWKYHGLPATITSDRGPQFASEFWKTICQRLKIERRLSTAFHPETDGQTERVNGIMEQYLRAFINYQQDDWGLWLPMAEFMGNNHASETTGMSPFFATYGFDPRMDFLDDQVAENGSQDADQFIQTMNGIHEHLRSEITYAQGRQQEGANAHRLPAPSFQPGDKVWLNAKNIRTRRPAKKLDNCRLGPFQIKEPVGTHAYRLALPTSMRIHDVFHVSLLDLVADNPLPGQQMPPLPPVEVDGELEWLVEEVLDSKIVGRQLRYLIRWAGYEETTWEPAETVDKLEAIEVFHERYPNKPGPLPL